MFTSIFYGMAIGVERKLLQAVQVLYQDSETAVWRGDDMTGWFEVERDVPQGCPMSP